ncbi:hypothetical protein APS_2687 [Acetobacter pasteurianus subsp. pasteurianus LMG 1262 = NBRC 106471]|nr:hypothetical protein APS_2687 [Acetobacter pasteurianus subsp. pasteurianus LMG 1262 = NBRC 106471]
MGTREKESGNSGTDLARILMGKRGVKRHFVTQRDNCTTAKNYLKPAEI